MTGLAARIVMHDIEDLTVTLRDLIEFYLYDGERDRALAGYAEMYDVAEAIFALCHNPDHGGQQA